MPLPFINSIYSVYFFQSNRRSLLLGLIEPTHIYAGRISVGTRKVRCVSGMKMRRQETNEKVLFVRLYEMKL